MLRSRRTVGRYKGRQIILVNPQQTQSKALTFLRFSPAIILAALTFFLVYYNFRLAESSSKQADLTERSIKLAEDNFAFAKKSLTVKNRPYIWVYEFKLLEYSVGKKFKVQVSVSNFGNTPAYNYSGNVYLKPLYGDFPEKPEYDMPDDVPSETIITPKKLVGATVETPKPLSLEMKNQIEEGDLKIYVYGKLEYYGFFDTKHTTTFCAFYNPTQNGFTYCDRHNRDY